MYDYIYICNIHLHRPKAQNLSISTQFCSEHLHQATSGCQQHPCVASSPKPRKWWKLIKQLKSPTIFIYVQPSNFAVDSWLVIQPCNFGIEWSWATDLWPVVEKSRWCCNSTSHPINVACRKSLFCTNHSMPQLRFIQCLALLCETWLWFGSHPCNPLVNTKIAGINGLWGDSRVEHHNAYGKWVRIKI